MRLLIAAISLFICQQASAAGTLISINSYGSIIPAIYDEHALTVVLPVSSAENSGPTACVSAYHTFSKAVPSVAPDIIFYYGSNINNLYRCVEFRES